MIGTHRGVVGYVAAVQQRGQAMFLVVIFLSVLMLSVLMLFNTSQLTRDKMKVQNAADAVAYSSAVLEARHLNFTAYTNRAMIANEVAIAQTISLATWLYKWAGTFRTFGNLTQRFILPIPIAGQIIAPPLMGFFLVLERGIATIGNGIAKFADVFAKLVSGFNTMLGYSQLAFRIGTYESMLVMSGTLQQGASDLGIPSSLTNFALNGETGLIQRNAPGARLGTLSQFIQFLNMFMYEKYNKNCKPANALGNAATPEVLDDNHACMKQMAAAVNDSRDLWTINRQNLGALLQIGEYTIDLPFFGKFGIGGVDFGLRQEGGTALRYISGVGPSSHRGHFNWSSMDTNEFLFSATIYIFGAPFPFELPFPLGWGTMQMSAKDKKDSQDYKLAPLPSGGAALPAGWDAAYGHSWDKLPVTSTMASIGVAPPPLWGNFDKTSLEGSYGDLSPFHTIDPEWATGSVGGLTINFPQLAPPPFVVWVYMPEKETHTSDNLRSGVNPAGSLELTNMAAGASSNDKLRLGVPFEQKPGIQAIASAAVYYKRFDSLHADGDEDEDGSPDTPELANAFSPYWGARLVNINNLVLWSAMMAQEPSLAWAFTGVEQSSLALAGQSENIKDDLLEEMDDGVEHAPEMIGNVVKDAVMGMFGL